MVGYCSFDHPTTGEKSFVACAELIPKLNCTDMDLLSSSCSCSCAASLDSTTGANKYNLTKAEERCKNGFIYNFVPKMQVDMEFPIVGDMSFTTYKIHWYCGEARGYLFEQKYEKALAASKEGCRELIAMSGGTTIWEQQDIADTLVTGMDIGKKLSSTSLSYDHAMNMMLISLAVAIVRIRNIPNRVVISYMMEISLEVAKK